MPGSPLDSAKRQGVALAGHRTPIVPAPPSGAIRFQQEVQASTVSQLLHGSGGLGPANGGIGQ